MPSLAQFRPVVRLAFQLYLREVRGAVYPRDLPERVVAGHEPLRLLFVGDVTAAGYGVLSNALTIEARVADYFAAASGRGCTWNLVSAPELRLAQIAAEGGLDATEVDVLVLLTGVPDVLLATPADSWADDLRRVAALLDSRDGETRMLVVAIPPMQGFRPVPNFLREALPRRIDALNAASHAVAEALPGVDYVPFPVERIDGMWKDRLFSWRTLYEAWARVIAGALLERSAR